MRENESFNINDILALVEKDTEQYQELSIALDSIRRHMGHCWYHYQEFKNATKMHKEAMFGILPKTVDIQHPEYYRCAFEANCFAFFRALHALIDSLPLIIYLLSKDLDFKEKVEWRKAKAYLKDSISKDLTEKLEALKQSDIFNELKDLVNITKHRRLPRIDSCIFTNEPAKFLAEDLGGMLSENSIEPFMERAHKVIVEEFLIGFVRELGCRLKQVNDADS
ncbi:MULTISPECIES: hypothetical protein [unclassified Pseudoalteromonas]|uniref:hypothetical protein n=1 Tax=unclassified Pseudoalteromonas TaxID=194690 RepID=UPI001F462751|nr:MULTISPECIES: hypothetical protein [unclassified Pseudoalteromonas]MCF2825808.1 hypothetical protein [Pseudoalteromonas sp. OF5H-5]MCF2830823.1 hypothetical protein [Pseudoalteromonas sp. DL2-H6]MCF2923632.1 hypothetical protein [Pseudoalteromonas sp. DL2-H1]